MTTYLVKASNGIEYAGITTDDDLNALCDRLLDFYNNYGIQQITLCLDFGEITYTHNAIEDLRRKEDNFNV